MTKSIKITTILIIFTFALACGQSKKTDNNIISKADSIKIADSLAIADSLKQIMQVGV